MAKISIQVGQTSQRIFIFVQDSSKTDGSGLTGLTNASSGLKWYVAREDDGNAGGTSVTPQSATKGTFTSGGFVEKDATNMPGVYELGIPNTALASGSKFCTMMLSGATNMAPVLVEIELVAYNPYSATNLGLSAIPTANPGAANGVLIAGTNAPVTITGSGDALTLTSTGANGAGLKATGQGSGNGMTLIAGASGKPNTPVVTSYTIVKNTLFNNFEFEMVLSSDHVSPATGKTVTVQRSIDGGAYADATNTPATEVSAGTYKINLSAADLNGNMITLKMTATGCDTTKIGIVTQS